MRVCAQKTEEDGKKPSPFGEGVGEADGRGQSISENSSISRLSAIYNFIEVFIEIINARGERKNRSPRAFMFMLI